MAATQTRRILVKVDTTDAKGLREIADKMGLLNKNTKSLSGNMAFLTNAFRGFLGFLGVREIVRMSDEMQGLFNRLKLVAGSVEAAEKALDGLNGVASRTNQSISGVAEVFNRIAVSLSGSGASVSELQTLTESLINTFRLAGATTTETTNTIIQLSQAFSSGELRGQELRSVMEQNATLALLLRERFGQDIYKKAAEGAIKVTDVLQVLAENQTRVNAEAKLLAPTIEQTLTKAMNNLSVAILKVNNEFQLSAKFAVVVETAMEKLGLVMVSLGAITAVLALQRLPVLVAGIKSLSAAMLGLVVANPYLAALAVVGTVMVATSKNVDDLADKFRNLGAWGYYLGASLRQAVLDLDKFISGTDASAKGLERMRVEQEAINKMLERAEQLGTPTYKGDATSQAPSAEAAMRDMESLIKKIDAISKPSGKVSKLKDELGALNKQLDDGVITIGQYNKKLIDFELYKANREFREGKKDVFAYNEQLEKLKIEETNRLLKEGTITLEQFSNRLDTTKLKTLTDQFEAGKISLTEYNTELIKLEDKVRIGSAFQVGVASYIESVGTLSQGVAKGIEQAFGYLETAFTDFIKTGTFNFQQFTQSVLDDLAQIIVRASIIQPLAKGILGYAGGVDAAGGTTSYSADYLASAKGNAFDGGRLQPFAKGGIVDSPTAFTYGAGKSGVMGEAGTEAILPLARGGNGDLGVQASVTPVTVNIINNAGAEITQQESTGAGGERNLQITINKMVGTAINSGSVDNQMLNSYGLRRKGSR